MYKIKLVEDETDYTCKNCIFQNTSNKCILGLIEDVKDIKLFEPCGKSHFELEAIRDGLQKRG